MSTPLRVLVVEDSEDDAILVLRELRRGGYEPSFERVDTPEAMHAALDQQTWDIVLSDYAMPQFSMPAALAMVKEKGLDLPFIIVSGAIGEEAAVAAMRDGAHDYVMKGNLAHLIPVVERELRDAEVRRERKRMQQALRDSEELYSALVGNLTDAVLMFKGDTVAWCNDRAEEIYGYPKEELLGKTTGFFYPSDISQSEFTREVSTAIRKHGLFRSTSRFQKKDGSFTDMEYSLSQIPGRDPVELIAVTRDVTKQKAAEEALQESEAHYRLLAENVTDIIVTVDMDLRFTYASPSVTRQLGYSVEEVTALSLDEILTPASLEVILKTFVEEMAVENIEQKDLSRSRALELEVYCKDGSTIWTEAEATFLRDPDGHAVGIVGVVRDISERKQAEEERKRLEQQLQLAGRLAAVGELAAGVAHELNNPLAAVQAFAQLLSDKDDLEETAKSDVETIYREAQRATRITANLLRFARRSRPEKRLVSLNEAVEKSLELHAYRMNVNNIEVVTELEPDLPMTMADSDQMHQVFVNIITNAEQAMTEAHGKGRLSVKTQKACKMIQITFTDSGPGISEDNMKSIFDPFFTSKDVGKGTGLGLSICYGIVQEHGGYIYANSKPGEGTTFTVEIPIVSEEQPIPEQTGSIEVQRAYDSPGRNN